MQHGTIYIGPTADDVRRILRDAGIEPFMIRDGEQNRPIVELSEGSVTILFAKLINEYVKVIMERDVFKMIADSWERSAARDQS
jgi:hypothetical protein